MVRAGTAPVGLLRLGRGQSERLVETSGLVVHLVTINPSSGTGPLHIHEAAQNTYLVLQGMLVVALGNASLTLTEGDAVFVPAGEPHATQNATAEPVRLLAIYDALVDDDFVIVSPSLPAISDWSSRGVVVSRFADRVSRPLRQERGELLEIMTAALGSSLDIHVNRISASRGPGPSHYHSNAKNFYFVLEGNPVINVGHLEHHMAVGDAVLIPPWTVHSETNLERASLVEIYAPAGADFVPVDAT
jgi:mannose-6-phosphate isomerase-like protein (cupin superfamily)